MRKLFIIVMCVLGIISTTSCSKDVVGEEFIQPAHEQKEIHLTFRAEPSGSNADTRTQLLVNDGNSVSWTSGDVITVFPNSDRGWPFITTQTDKSVFFEGFVHTENSQYFAIYPHIEGNTFDGERVFSTTFPAEQKAVANSFADDANITVAKTTSAEMSFAFKNVCGLVKFKFDAGSDDIPFTKAVLQGKNSENLAGAMTITYDGSANPTASITGTGKTITLSLAKDEEYGVIPTFEKNKDYYFVVPPIIFSKGYKITFSDEDGVYNHVWDVTNNSSSEGLRTITRSNILNADSYTFKEVVLDNVSVDVYTVKDGDVLTGTLANNRRISVPAGYTITLKNATIEHTTTTNSAIYCDGNATINFIGNNTVSTNGNNKNGIGVGSSKTLTMKGSGSLIVAGGSGGKAINNNFNITLTGLKMYEGDNPYALSLAGNQKKCNKRYVSINNEVVLGSTDYTAADGDVLTGTLTPGKRLTIPDGATVTLKDVTISTNSSNHAITCNGNATIILEGTNTVTTGSGKSGISVASNKELIIKGSGSLSTSGNGAAGIAGIVSVYDGTITATSSGTGAGIKGKVAVYKGHVIATGLGAVGIDGEVLVSGSGILTANGGNNAAGIKGDVSISGIGQITATGGTNGAGILGNVSTYGGTLTANGTGNVGINGGVIVSGGALSINGGNGFAGVSGAVTIYDGSITTIGGDAVAANGNGGNGVTKDIAAFGGSVSAFGGAGNGTGTAGRGVGGTVSLGDGMTMSHSDDNSEYTIVSGEIFESTKRYVKIQ